MKTIKSILVILLTAGFATAQTAQETISVFENESGFGIRAAGMGNAYTGLANDYSAIYWNPAGLAQIEFGNISASLNHNNFENSIDYLGVNTTDSRTFTKLQNFGLAYAFPVRRGSFVIGLGYQKVNNLDFFADFSGYATTENEFGFDGDTGFEPTFNREIQQDYSLYDEGSIDYWSFAAAIDLSRNFSAGITLNFIGGDKNYNLDYLQDDITDYWDTYPDDFKYLTNSQKIITDYRGFNIKLGGLFHISEQLQLGTTITFPHSVTVEEEWKDDLYLTYDTNEEYELYSNSGSFDYIVKLPFQFGAGLAFTNDLFTVSSSIDYRDWSQLKYEVPDNRSIVHDFDYDDLLDQNQIIREDFRSVLSYALGAELNVMNSGLMLRGGYRYLPNPQKNLGTEFDKKFYSFGLGYKVDKRTTLDFGFTQGEWKNKYAYVYSSGNSNESVTSQVFQFGINYNF